jgi:glucose-6-phosphate isomerase
VSYKNFFLEDNIKKKHFKSSVSKQLSKKFNKIFLDINSDIKNKNKTLNVLDKKFQFNFKIKDLNKFKKFKTIAIVGMGGSILGVEAIYKFLEKKIKKKVYFFNDLDENILKEFKKKEIKSKVLFIIISKSGNTIETLSNTFLLNVINRNAKNIIIISEKKNNFLNSLSKKFNLFHIEHKKNIGGRYSVLSEVGIIPAYLMGVNIFKLRSNLLNCFKKINKLFIKNQTLKLTNIMNSKKINNLIFLNYSPELKNFLFWCQQLIAESLGKKNLGFLPVVSSAPKDHHSLLQLYLDGPKDKVFNIFSLNSKSSETIKVNHSHDSTNFLNKKKLSVVKNAQKNSLVKSFIKKGIPFREFKIKKINEEALGELFSLFIIETVIIGKLLNINPFDQPAVEEIKIDTKKFLK